jgi:hypothetical protein
VAEPRDDQLWQQALSREAEMREERHRYASDYRKRAA